MYANFRHMNIDKDILLFDPSDHHFISTTFNVRLDKGNSYTEESKSVKYIKITEDTRTRFLDTINDKLKDTNIEGNLYRYTRGNN